jgi:hypothetical protein
MFGTSPAKFPTIPEGFFSSSTSRPLQIQQRETGWLVDYSQPQENTPRDTLKDYEEEDCGSGREADNEETEEEGFYDSEYDQNDADRENRFWDNEEEGGPRDMEINPKLQPAAERPASRAGSENGKRRRIEEPTEQIDLDIIRNSVSPPPEQEDTGDLWEYPIIQQL